MAATLCLAVGAYGCGDDEEKGAPSAGSNSAEYCEVVARADRAGDKAFSALESDPNATQAQYQAAERNFVEENSELFDELIAVAPAEIADDVKTLVAAQRGLAGVGPSVPQAKVHAAEQRVKAFEAKNCEAP